jgi:biliverdin reductase
VSLYRAISQPVRIGLVGTGFAAKARAQALQAESRAQLVAVASSSPARAQEFATEFNIRAADSWEELIKMPDVDLVMICNANSDHGQIAKAAIESIRHVIVEYPLSLEPQEAQEIIFMAANRQLFLHIEHIELLGSLHQTMREWLDKIGTPQYARYATITPQAEAPRKWSFNRQQFGFPLAAALSRLHRFTDLFGVVDRVNCHENYWGLDEEDYFKTVLCTAQMTFANGLFAEISYGKGENLWEASRKFAVHGDQGAMIFDGNQGTLIVGTEKMSIELGSRRGMFAQDLTYALANFLDGQPNYIKPSASLYSLRIANACKAAATNNATVLLPPNLRGDDIS